jgi:UDP-N-acetyl-2-amino-2-deoxyglucuronate dehydrogenase
MPEQLCGAVIGCGGMGRGHARAIAASREVELLAVCDLDEALAQRAAEARPGVRVYTDAGRMLAEVRPEIVAVVTPTDSHAALTVQAAEAGVRGICCEKPMATCMGDARAMVDACERHGAALIVNHQRRMLPALVRMRELIVEGAIGEVTLLRGTCAGDLLSDGTHLIDSLLHLAGDEDAAWVFGALYREPPKAGEPRGMGYHASGGYRYGHPIETGALGTWEFQSRLRAEILTGELRLPGRRYQDYEVLGTKGRLWRPSDGEEPGLCIQTAGAEGWQPVEIPGTGQNDVITRSYDLLARNLREGGDHPLSADRALRGFEILMAIYESARLRARIDLPLEQERFPLEMMIEA